VHADKIAAVEVHNKVLRKPYETVLSFDNININAVTVSNFKVASDHDKLLNAVLPK
jgi:hypothetical protein